MTLIITHFSLESKFGSSHLISVPFMPSDTQGSNKGPPQLSVPNQLLDAAPAVAQEPHLCLDSALPCVFRSATFVPFLSEVLYSN